MAITYTAITNTAITNTLIALSPVALFTRPKPNSVRHDAPAVTHHSQPRPA